MPNINNNMQTQTSNTLHNAIMEAGSKDRWKEKPILDAEGNPTNSSDKVFETYKTVTQEIRDQLNVEAVQIILNGIDNDIYSTVDACPNAEVEDCGFSVKGCTSVYTSHVLSKKWRLADDATAKTMEATLL
uniref:Uncharacterized protein n=1 Tax=Tanacetum cinerariifolium TaxID=118510 RepID=A0A6L2KSD7_TANCI|nr:hypothetical protein [Tanacetum cinerariifolium]